jgi:hypothetical protein
LLRYAEQSYDGMLKGIAKPTKATNPTVRWLGIWFALLRYAEQSYDGMLKGISQMKANRKLPIPNPPFNKA